MKKIKYFLDNMISKGTGALMVMLVLVSLFFVFVIGSLAYFIRVDNVDYFTTLWYTFNHIVDPGYLFGQGGETIAFFILMTLATFWGILVYSLIITFVSTALYNRLEDLRSGRSLIYEKMHTVILDFNTTVPMMLQELILAHEKEQNYVVVILSHLTPQEVFQSIRQVIPKQHVLKIIVRTGSIYRKEDLDMVSVEYAQSIILATPSDVTTIKTLLALKQTAFYEDDNSNHAVCMIRDLKNMDMAKELGGKHLEVIYVSELKSKVFARSTLHPGLSHIYKNLFSFSGEEIYFLNDERFLGKTFESLVLCINKASVIGIQKNNTPYINPDKETLFEEGDALIVIETNKNDYVVEEKQLVDIKNIYNQKPYIHTGRKILTIGYNKNTPYVAKDMETYVGENSLLTMLIPNEINAKSMLSKFNPTKYVSFETHIGETFIRKNLEALNIENFDTIAIFANQDVTHDNADAETLLSLLHIHTISKNLKQKPSVVIEIEETKNVDALAYVNVDDFLVSNVLVSKIMIQIAENRYANSVIQELVSDYGNEFYLRRANAYIKQGHPQKILVYHQAALLKKQLFIGYKKFGESLVLNPDKDLEVSFGNDDRIVVVSFE
jgi:K+/H+ antiporter YhaU regulatory subunit KhtT